MRARWSTKTKLGQQGWIVFERPVPGTSGDLKYYFSNLPIETPDVKLVEYIHRRHVIERFYQDAKDELGLDQYEVVVDSPITLSPSLNNKGIFSPEAIPSK